MPAFAHAVIVRASLEDAAIKPDTASEVTLVFNSKIETAFCQVSIVDAAGNARKLDFKVGPSSERLIVSLPPLPAGAYAIRYKVLSADGHFTDNVLRFKISANP
ncbi:MAG: copper resistance protein CopC [Rhodospirillales bacterium]|nr:copper resistance protein CopC [Rhodospirillales bacterium]